MEGRRPLLPRCRRWSRPSPLERPRRTTSGLDSSRVAMVLAVLQQHAGIRLHHHDVFASTVGGARLTEPATDLAIALAIAARTSAPAAARGVVAMGEIGLAGELRRVRDLPQRLAEAARLGFQLGRRARASRASARPARRPRWSTGMRVVDVDARRSARCRCWRRSTNAPTRTRRLRPLD